jgi:4-hydroxy-3-polyprenylbenzoate decarboxylase
MPFNDLREFLGLLEEKGQLLKTKRPVDVKFEISAYIRKTSDEHGPALLFENVKNSSTPVLGGVFATRERAFLALETTADEYVQISARPGSSPAAETRDQCVVPGGCACRTRC